MVSLEIRQFLFGLPKQSLIFWEPEFLDLILSEHLQKAVTGKKNLWSISIGPQNTTVCEPSPEQCSILKGLLL